jgi:hypothetical protein
MNVNADRGRRLDHGRNQITRSTEAMSPCVSRSTQGRTIVTLSSSRASRFCAISTTSSSAWPAAAGATARGAAGGGGAQGARLTGAALTDAVLQAGLRYETVVWPQAQHGMEAFPAAATTSGFLAVLRERGGGRGRALDELREAWPHGGGRRKAICRKCTLLLPTNPRLSTSAVPSPASNVTRAHRLSLWAERGSRHKVSTMRPRRFTTPALEAGTDRTPEHNVGDGWFRTCIRITMF